MKPFCATLTFCCATLLGVAVAQTDPKGKIQVSGDAVVYVVPDQVRIAFEIVTRDRNLVTAKTKSSAVLQAVVKAARSMGLADRDIQTDYLEIEPRYEGGEATPSNFQGYFVSNRFLVTVGDAALAEQLIVAALEAGVNHVRSVDFETTAVKPRREEARRMALEAAREKAERMSAALGARIGKPLEIREEASGYRGSRGDPRYALQQAMAVEPQSDIPPEVGKTLALGKVAVSAKVTVVFELLN